MMPIIIDIIIVVIFALCVLAGYKKGLAGCLIKLLAFFIAAAIAFMLFKPVSSFVIENTQVDENIHTSIVQVFESEENKQKEDENNNESVSPVVEYISNQVKEGTAEKKNEIVQSAATELTNRIINVLSFIGVFLVARIILGFVKALTDIITKLPLIKECDKIGGIIYGVLQFLVIACIALALINFIATITNQYTLVELINQSYIGNILNDNNILMNVVF